MVQSLPICGRKGSIGTSALAMLALEKARFKLMLVLRFWARRAALGISFAADLLPNAARRTDEPAKTSVWITHIFSSAS
jgi:1-deoxy-D-xylulose 5-phosphate reductoisomerase